MQCSKHHKTKPGCVIYQSNRCRRLQSAPSGFSYQGLHRLQKWSQTDQDHFWTPPMVPAPEAVQCRILWLQDKWLRRSTTTTRSTCTATTRSYLWCPRDSSWTIQSEISEKQKAKSTTRECEGGWNMATRGNSRNGRHWSSWRWCKVADVAIAMTDQWYIIANTMWNKDVWYEWTLVCGW